jgi:hypothetical protein
MTREFSRQSFILGTPSTTGHAGGQRPRALPVRSSPPQVLDFVHYSDDGGQAARPRSFLAGSDITGDMIQAAADSIVAAISACPDTAGSA